MPRHANWLARTRHRGRYGAGGADTSFKFVFAISLALFAFSVIYKSPGPPHSNRRRNDEQGGTLTATNERKTGTVTYFDRDRGLGYITPDDKSGDIRVHWSNVLTWELGYGNRPFYTLHTGQRVKFNVGTWKNRYATAKDVEVVSDPNPTAKLSNARY